MNLVMFWEYNPYGHGRGKALAVNVLTITTIHEISDAWTTINFGDQDSVCVEGDFLTVMKTIKEATRDAG